MAKEKHGFIKGAYELDGPADNRRHYDGWAPTYEKTMAEYGYVAPAKAAAMLRAFCGDTDAPVLDVGCGTGLSGAALRECGFSILDGIDVSSKMLAVAAAGGAYRRLWAADLTAGLDCADGAYGAAFSVGAFTVGHLRPRCLDELIRATRAGGVVVITVNEMVFEKDEYEAHIARLRAAGAIEEIDRSIDDYMRATDNRGYYLAFRVLARG